MTPRDLAEKILILFQMPASDSAYSDSRNGLPMFLKNDLESLLRAHDDELIESIALHIEKEAEDWSCPDCHDAMLLEMAKIIRQLKHTGEKP